jgi:antitoxin component of MazEF toxin-antitoxin module
MAIEEVVTVQKRMLVSLAKLAKEINLGEGDHLIAEIVNGGIFLRPVGWHDKNQEYIWSDKWQDKFKRAQDDLTKQNYKKFDNMEDLIRELGVEEDADTDS